MDILGDHAMLAYECKADGTAKTMAILKMVKPVADRNADDEEDDIDENENVSGRSW